MDKLTICNAALRRCGAEPILVGELTTPTTKRGASVVGQYDVTLGELLSDSPWNFTIKKSKIDLQSKAITSWSNVGAVVTLVVNTGHGFVANDVISVKGLLTNGLYPPNTDGVKIDSVTATQIVYTFTSTPTGTPTVDSTIAFVSASDLFGYKYRYALPADCIRVLELEDKVEYRVESTGIVCNEKNSIQIKYTYNNTDPTKYSPAFIKALTLKLAEDISYELVQSASLQKQISEEAERYLRKARSMNSQEGTPEARYPVENTFGVRQ